MTIRQLCRAAVATLLGCFSAGGTADAADWTPVPVPGAWEQQAEGRFAEYDGFAWYRCYVKVPGRWVADDHPRKLWARSVTLSIDSLTDAYEAYINGEKVGEAGSLPPEFRRGKPGYRRHSVPLGVLHKGRNVIAIRVYNEKGPGGFQGPPPVIAGYYKEIALNGTWEFRTGDDLKWAKDGDEPLSGDVVYEKAVPATTPLKRPAELAHGPGLPPEKALKKLTTVDDVTVEQVLSEPTVAQPVSLSFDEQGRLWVVEYRQYPWPEGLTMQSRDKYYRAVYEEELPPPPYDEDSPYRGRDRISIHEDTDGDGTFDRHKTFLDGLNITTAIAQGDGGVWVLSPPQLLFYPDENRDDVPDGPPEVHLTGFGLQDTHSVVNSLTWGPDGWLYAAQGSTVSARVKRPGAGSSSPRGEDSRSAAQAGEGTGDDEAVYSEGPVIWRYHPERRKYEIFAEGGGNAFSVEIDSKGRLFSGHNGGDTRGFHYMQGGYYSKGLSGKYGPISNPYTFGLLPDMQADAPIKRFTHSCLVYEGHTLPSRYRGNLLCADPLNNNVVLAERKPRGSTFATTDLGYPLQSEDVAFRPVALALGPDGAVYVADFYNFYIAHGQHYSGKLDPTTGRVYRLQAKDAQNPRLFDISGKNIDELIGLLEHENRRVRRSALRLLGQRGDQSTIRRLTKVLDNNDGQLALEALWAINLLGGFDEDLAVQTLAHPNPHVRQWTVRLAGDDKQVSDRLGERLSERAAVEPNAEVRSQLACTAQRLPAGQGLPIVRQLLTRDADADDPHIPLLLWWAIEAKCDSDRQAVLGMFERPALWKEPLVRKHILSRLMRRFAAAGGRENLLTCAKLLETAPQGELQQTLLAGFEKALEGRTLSNPPQKLMDAIAKAGGGSLVLRLRQRDEEAVMTAMQIIGDPQADVERRRRLAEVFGEIGLHQSAPVLLRVVERAENTGLRKAALGALRAYGDSRIGERVLDLYNELPAELRLAAGTLLASRPEWAKRLMRAVKSGRIGSEHVPPEVVAQLRLHQDPQVEQLVTAVWGGADGTSAEIGRRSIDEVQQIIAAGSGNPYRGKLLFRRHCGNCHKLFGDGGDVGPDLTSFNRDDTRGLLRNVLTPSAEIREGYENYLVLTADGRVVSGFLIDRDERTVVLRTADGQNATIPRKRIVEMRQQDKSLMPDGILTRLSASEIRDLFAYLQAGQPVPD